MILYHYSPYYFKKFNVDKVYGFLCPINKSILTKFRQSFKPWKNIRYLYKLDINDKTTKSVCLLSTPHTYLAIDMLRDRIWNSSSNMNQYRERILKAIRPMLKKFGVCGIKPSKFERTKWFDVYSKQITFDYYCKYNLKCGNSDQYATYIPHIECILKDKSCIIDIIKIG